MRMRHNNRMRLQTAAASALLAVLALSAQGGPDAFARGLPSLRPAAAECEGDACAHVTVTFDESKQQYRAQNNSTERWARVTASNMAGSASACLAPGGEAYLPLKDIAGAYRAAYAEARCGAAEPNGPPSGE